MAGAELPRERSHSEQTAREIDEEVKRIVDEAIQNALGENRAPTNADIERAIHGRHHRTQFTGETEWYTPAEYVEAARACLGGIDLDPATSPLAQDTIRAARFFTRDDPDSVQRDGRDDRSASTAHRTVAAARIFQPGR